MDAVKRRRAAIYCRMSQDREGAGLGVERQRADCEAKAAELGWTVTAVHVDNDVSAYSGKPRKGYRALTADLEAGTADAVLVWHTDRLHRSPAELEDYVKLCDEHKIVTQTVQAGLLDLATPSGRMNARMLGAAARYEVEHKSERTKRAQRQAAEAGRWLGGLPPLGWNVQPDGTATLDRAAARRIRRATADVLAGVSLGSIVSAWNAAGFTTGTHAHGCEDKAKCVTAGRRNRGVDCPKSTPRTWTYTSLRQVLTRARNAGLTQLHGETVGKSMWPALVSEDQWRAVCALLANPDRRRSQSNRAKWLLAGIALCGSPGCGLPLRSATVFSNRARGTTRTVYRCPAVGKGHVARSAVECDDFINGLIERRIAQPDFAEVLTDDSARPDAEALRGEAVALRQRLADLPKQLADASIPAHVTTEALRAIQDRLRAVERDLAAAGRGSVFAGVVNAADPVKAWQASPIERRRAMVRAYLLVTVLPSGRRGNVFDPDLIDVRRRHAV